jgi:hypothetical protein
MIHVDLLLKTPSWSRVSAVQRFAMFVPQSRVKRICWGVQWTFWPSGNMAEANSAVRETMLGQHDLIVPLNCGSIDHLAQRGTIKESVWWVSTDLVGISLRNFQPWANTLEAVQRLIDLMLHRLERRTHSTQDLGILTTHVLTLAELREGVAAVTESDAH